MEESIPKWLKEVRFQRALLSGVKEADVWKKIGELNAMYEAALAAERVRYDTLLQERTGRTPAEIHEEQEKAGDEEDG